jgi:hypothetical protein
MYPSQVIKVFPLDRQKVQSLAFSGAIFKSLNRVLLLNYEIYNANYMIYQLEKSLSFSL